MTAPRVTSEATLLRTIRRGLFGIALLLGVFAVMRVGGRAIEVRAFDRVGRARLERVYVTARQLRYRMNRGEVIRALSAVQGEGVTLIRHDDGNATLLVWIGYTNTCQLSVWFERDQLVGTHIVGEDGPHDLCPGSPPDITAAAAQG